jgi:predicted acyl esterase
MPVETGGRMIQRAPNDPAWYRGGLYHDDQKLNVPGLWFMSWYDVSVGPNLALYNHVRKTAPAAIADQQWAVIAPGGSLLLHARDRRHGRRRAQHGRRPPRLQRHRLRLLRSLPQGREDDAARHAAEGHLLHDGHEQVADADTWPPAARSR